MQFFFERYGKKMKKTLRTVVASLLLLVMLFSVSVTTVFAAGETLAAGSGNTGAYEPITPPVNTPNGVDLGWISVKYDDDSLDIVWHHRFEAMLNTLSTNPEILNELSQILVDGFEHLVIDSIQGGFSGDGSDGSGSGIVVDINDMEGLLKTAINAYLKLDPNEEGYIESILDFFEILLGQDMNAENSEAHKFSQYVCDLISFAVSSGKITLDELKAKIADGDALKATIDNKIYNIIDSYAAKFIEDNLPGMIDKYVLELKGQDTDLPDEIIDFIETVAISFAKTEAECYLNGQPIEVDGTVIETFIFSQVKTVLGNLLPHYAKMKKNPGTKFWEDTNDYASAYVTAFEEIDDYVDLAIKNYIEILCGITPEKSTVLDNELQNNATVTQVFNDVISDELGKVVAYIEGNRLGTKPESYDIFADAIASYFANTKIDDSMITAEYADFLRANETTFKNLFEDQFDIELQKIIDYIAGGRILANKPANYDIFATIFADYFDTHNTIDTIPNSILVKYINSNKATLTEKFGDEFDAEYAKVIAGQPSALYDVLEKAFNDYFAGRNFDGIDKALVSEYLDLKGDAIKQEFVDAKLAEINVDTIINNIVAYVKAKAAGQSPEVPDYYEEFKTEFNNAGLEYNSAPVTLEELETNLTAAEAVLTTANISSFRTDFDNAVEDAVDEAWLDIVAYAKLENPTTPAPENYPLFVSEFNDYLASNAITFDTIGTDFLAKPAVKTFIEGKVDFEKELDEIVKYLDGTSAEPESYSVFESVFNDYFANNKITLDNVSADLISDIIVKTEIKDAVDFSTEYGKIVTYIENGKLEADKPDSYDVFALAFNNYFASKDITLDLIPDTVPLSFLKSYVNDSDKKNSLIAKFKDTIKNANATDKAAYHSKITAVIEAEGGIIDNISEASLKSIIDSVNSDTIVNAVETILKTDASYKASFVSVINGLSDATIVGFLEEIVSDSNFDVDSMVDDVKGAFFDADGNLDLDDETYDAALKFYLGLTKAELDAAILKFEDVIADDYDAMITELENGGGSFEMVDLLKYLKSVSINGKTLVAFDDGTKADVAAIKALLLETLPSFSTLSKMTNEELENLVHWEVEIVTAFSGEAPLSAKFDFNVSVGSNFSEVREFAAAMNELVNVSREDGKITLDVNLFDNFADVLSDFINSDKISPSLRAELFELMGLSLEDIYSYVSDRTRFTFAKYKTIVSAIDFEEIFKNFGIENEQNGIYADYNALMVKILCQNEKKFEKVRQKLLDTIDSVPESLKSKAIFDVYEGNGKFSYANKAKISASALISRFGDSVPALQDFITVIKGIVGNRSFEANVELNVNGPKLYKVTYVVTDPQTGAVVTKTGLLPEGTTVQGFFTATEKYAGNVIERYNGYRIEKWSLTNGGDAVTAIPAYDVVLYATLENIKTAITVYDNNDNSVDSALLASGVTYDEDKSYVLEVSVSYTQNTFTPKFAYQWYKGSLPIIGATQKTLVVNSEVSNSGVYWCRVIVVSDGAMSGASVDSPSQTVTINKKAINIKDYGLEWNYDSEFPFTYSGSSYSVALTPETLNKINAKGLPEITETPIYTNVIKSDAGNYKARASFSFANVESGENYVLVNADGIASESGFAYVECDWTIEPKKLSSTEDFEWSVEDGASLTYEYGKTHSVTLALPEGLVVEKYTGNAGTYAGSYTTVAYVKSSDPNYVWVGEDPTISWEIAPQLFDLAQLEWNYNPEEPIVFNGSEQSVALVGVPEDIVWLYADNVQTFAGSYVSSVEPDPNNALNSKNYIFKGEAPKCEWTIEKQSIESLLELDWNYSEALTYNGSAQSVELVIPDGFDERITVVYSDNVAVDAGSYTAKATLVALDADNFEVVGEAISFECAWIINKAKADMSGISFKDKTVIETGEAIGIEIEGTLPKGITVQYSEPQVAVGKYEMTATFIYNENNFEPIAPMTATLIINRYYPNVNSFTNLDSAGNVIVDIKAQNEISSKYTLNVKDLSTQYVGYDFGNLFGPGTNGKVISVYDIHFAENGTETPLNNVFTVKLLLPDNFSGNINNVRVVHIAENGEITDMNAMPTDGNSYMAYETIHFSIYAIVEVVERVEETEEFDLLSLVPYVIVVLAVLLLLIIIIVVIKKKRKKNEPEEPVATEEPKPEEPQSEEGAEAETEPEAEAEQEAEAAVEEAETEEVEAEAPVEKKPALVIHDSVEDIVEEASAQNEEAAPITNEIVHVRCRSSFTSRLIQSEPPIQDYYTVLKNALLSYKGVKARMSFNFESFNSGRVQCAKLNVKGKSFLVYLGLDLDEYNVNKYHFSDASDKPKFEKVPMMLKVKSDRSLRYALELIDEVMKKNGFDKDPKFVEQDYHMPYETTAALAEKELVKLILPQGVSLAEGIKLVKADVGAFLDEAKSGEEDDED